MQNLFVLKFGGSSLATPEQIREVARKISELFRSGKKLIVVTSAMGKTTDELTALAHKVSMRPNRRELDMLLSTGERISMSLLSMALHDFNCPSISFTGSQAGIMTDGAFSNAQIKEIKPIRVEQALQENKVVVLAGFQGVDPSTKEITTLGRGGSDTTAVAMAAHFQAERCEILKDVDGVFNADPKVVPNAQIIKTLPIDKLYEMCFWGAKVLNYRSVEWARKHHVPLLIGRSDNFSIGTEVVCKNVQSNNEEIEISETKNSKITTHTLEDLLAVNSHEHVLELSITGETAKYGEQELQQFFSSNELPEPQILQLDISANQSQLRALITAPLDVLRAAKPLLSDSAKIKILREDISSVTATFHSRPHLTQVVPHKERTNVIRGFFTTSPKMASHL